MTPVVGLSGSHLQIALPDLTKIVENNQVAFEPIHSGKSYDQQPAK